MRRLPLLLLTALSLAACDGGSGHDSPAKTPKAAAEPAETAQGRPAVPAHATPPRPPADKVHEGLLAPSTQPAAAPFTAAGTSDLTLSLSAPFEMAGFELHLAFEAKDFRAAQPVISDQLQGFLCAANPDIDGGFKYICASVPARRAEGLLATIPISWSARAPTLADLRVEKIALVDVDAQEAPEGVELVLAVTR